MSSPRSVPWPMRLTLILGGVLLSVVIVELVLQAARAANWIRLDSMASPRGNAVERVIGCIGDSHTYGFGVGIHPQVQSYPAQLRVMLNGGAAEGYFAVDNLGMPGRNTALSKQRLRRFLDENQCDVVLLLAGFNNAWNPAEAGDLKGESAGFYFVLPRLTRLLLLNDENSRAPSKRAPSNGSNRSSSRQGIEELRIVDGQPVAVDGQGREQPIQPTNNAREDLRHGKELQASIHADLTEMVAMCREAGCEVILQTYATQQNDTFELANATTRIVARETSTDLVDHYLWFRDHPEISHAAAFQPDGHPTAYGYRFMAQAVYEFMKITPPYSGWPVGQPAGSASPPPNPASTPTTIAPGPTLEDGTATLDLTGPALAPWRVVFSRSKKPGPGLQLEADELFRHSYQQIGLCGQLDQDGNGCARVYDVLSGEYAGETVFAQLLIQNPAPQGTDDVLSATSEVIEWTFPPAR